MNEFHVGLPCLKLSLNPSNQRHKGKAARTCSVKKAWEEMNDLRKGRDASIDHELTKNNVWLCGSSDMDMELVIQAEIDRINTERKAHGRRALRKDTVSAIEIVQKIPMEIMQSLSEEEQLKIIKDGNQVLRGILHDWQSGWKIVATVIHCDEMGGKSKHDHSICLTTSFEEDGCLTMNAKKDFNLKFFTFMNREYPKRMRELGYPVLDCEIYEDMTEEERAKHAEKKKDYGLEGYEYKQKKAAEQEAQIETNQAVIETQAAQISDQKKEIEAVTKSLAVKNEEVSRADKQLVSAKEETSKANAELNDINKKIKSQKKESDRLGAEILTRKEIKALPSPASTFDGKYFKIPKEDYKSILATAKSVDKTRAEMAAHEKNMAAREASLAKEKKQFEDSRKLPFKEKIELGTLRKLKESVQWIVNQLSEHNLIRKLLERALGGEDLTVTQGKELQHRVKRNEMVI
ncbi:hypothetical protein SAMN02910275_02932 [Butyrivibrio sp. INlla18]|uniref:hypothetical protein n=1 Tax=Butyrivibrio sp. INlla18 TaxID=1520806 RepID=UPI00087E0907|nr:hypothetical protein [Butyrivibrio sp. INlla18]SDA79092.1 hypothetical protein SAMN02910275_02932 [Butyrivibrio sp. INlla18]